MSEKIPNVRINYKDDKFGEFNYKMLMNKQDFSDYDLNTDIVDIYKENAANMPYKINYKELSNDIMPIAFYNFIENFSDYDINIVVDNLVYHLFHKMKSEKKLTLWTSFGDIIYGNLTKNLKSMKLCENCGKLIMRKSNRTKYCSVCAKEINAANMRRLNKKRYHCKS